MLTPDSQPEVTLASDSSAVGATPSTGQFVGRLLVWFLGLMLPLSFAASVAHVYVHEFAHGLAALATGGHFIGVRAMSAGQAGSWGAFADAWSDAEGVVYAAGIVVSVALGLVILGLGLRAKGLLPRMFLLVVASSFLDDVAYALHGCLTWKTGDGDVAVLLRMAPDSPALRWVCVGVSFALLTAIVCVQSKALFRCWERVFGPLSRQRAFWIVFLLVNPYPMSLSPGWGEGDLGLRLGLCVFVAVTVWLIWTRDRERTAEAVPVRVIAAWALLAWLFAGVAVPAFASLYTGLRIGTYPAMLVTDIRPDERTVAGYVVHYGLGQTHDGERVEERTELFVGSSDEVQTFIPPPGALLDVLWRGSPASLVVITAEGIFRVDPSSPAPVPIWEPRTGRVTSADHGTLGHLVVTVEIGTEDEPNQAVYLHDFESGRGGILATHGVVGYPFFDAVEPMAWVTVDRDLWEVSFDDGDVANWVERHEEGSGDLWFVGLSGDERWFYGDERWICGETRISSEGVGHWGCGNSGFYTVHPNDTWLLTRPDGGLAELGQVDADSIVGLRVYGGVPWVALEDGTVRPLKAGDGGFRFVVPR